MNEYLSFRKMITPTIIQALFWIGAGVCAILGLAQIVAGAARGSGGAIVLNGLLTLLIGPILVRVYCELIILMFRIYDELKGIRQGRLGESADQAAAPQPPAPQ